MASYCESGFLPNSIVGGQNLYGLFNALKCIKIRFEITFISPKLEFYLTCLLIFFFQRIFITFLIPFAVVPHELKKKKTRRQIS